MRVENIIINNLELLEDAYNNAVNGNMPMKLYPSLLLCKSSTSVTHHDYS